MSDEKLIGTAEAMRILDVDRTTVTRMAADGRLTIKVRLPGKNGAFLFARDAVVALRDRRRQVPA